MPKFFLDSVSVDNGAWGPIGSGGQKKRTLYQVGDGERIAIKPKLPETGGYLQLFLLTIGCPKDVVAVILEKAKRAVGGWIVDDGNHVMASRSHIGSKVVVLVTDHRCTKVSCLVIKYKSA